MNRFKAFKEIQTLLDGSGITVNGPNPWDMHISGLYAEQFLHRVREHGSIGLGEAYMDRWWTCASVDEFFNKILLAGLDKKSQPWRMIPMYMQSLLFNRQTRLGSRKVADKHYNLSVQLYMSFLDFYNQYTCGYWKNAKNLTEAQIAKLHLACQKLQLKPGDHVLDIGCGWGGFARFAAENYGVKVTGITIAEMQAEFAKNFTKGLPVDIRIMDYRDLGKEKFDAVNICGMIEHVGYRNYDTIMMKVYESLKDGGLFLLHTIGGLDSVTHTDTWIDKYIFPNSMLPSAKQITSSFEGLFTFQDFQNFGMYYDQTLMAWYENFKSNWNESIPEYARGDEFYRMWEYYLLSCAGSFRSGRNQLFHFVLQKNPTKIYTAVR